MERINQFAFYDLGDALAKISPYEGDVPLHLVMWDIWSVQRELSAWLAGKPLPLGVSKTKAAELKSILDGIASEFFFEKKPDGTTGLKFPGPEENIPSWRWYRVKQALTEFITVFREEMRETATYFVPRRGIFYTPALVDTADESFPADVLPFIPQKARDDWKAAGRCLAFNLLSASGFHAASRNNARRAGFSGLLIERAPVVRSARSV